MIDLTKNITNAQIAFGVAVIAFVLVFHVFRKDINEMLKRGKKNH